MERNSKITQIRQDGSNEASDEREIYLDEQQLQALRRIAAENYVTPSDLVSLAVETMISKIPNRKT